MIGIVKRVIKNKSYGFILGDDGNEYFFHAQDLMNLEIAQIDYELGHRREVKVIFNPRPSPKGIRAAEITLADPPD